MAQKMYLQRVRFKAQTKTGPKIMYRAAVKGQSVIRNDKLIQNICNHAGQKASCVRAILTALPESMNDYLEAGNAVQVDNLCTFKPKIKSKASLSEKKCTANTIIRRGVNTWPIGQTKEMVNQFQFAMLDSVVDGEDPENEQTANEES